MGHATLRLLVRMFLERTFSSAAPPRSRVGLAKKTSTAKNEDCRAPTSSVGLLLHGVESRRKALPTHLGLQCVPKDRHGAVMHVKDMLPAFLELAVSASDPSEYRVTAMRELRRCVGFDNALFRPGATWSGASPTYLEETERFTDLYIQSPDRYRDELGRWCEASRGSRAFAFDHLYTRRERQKMATEAEVLSPARVDSLMGCPLRFGGATVGLLFLFRHGRGTAFSPETLEVVTQILPAIAVSQAALQPVHGGDSKPVEQASTPESRRASALSALTPREAQIARLIAKGLTSKEIATAFGTSFHTVRKQTLRIYERVGVHNRAGLASLLAHVPATAAR